MQMEFEFWFEFASTYSYPAAMRIEALAADAGIAVEWKPFLLGPIFQAQGWNDSPFNIYPAKGRYMWRDMERLCADLKIPLRHPSQFPRNGVIASRVVCGFAGESWLPDFIRAIYRANFADDLDISNADVVVRCLDALGQNGAEIIVAAQLPENKDKLRRQTEQAIAKGIFGAPTFMVGKEMFWGNDRLETAIAWYKERAEG
jgi:2-hydroxychromene-2-carboxylate isomerase